MLRAAFLPDFGGYDTLLIWGGNLDMEHLDAGLRGVRQDERSIFEINGGAGLTTLRIRSTRGNGQSILSGVPDALEWVCSRDGAAST